MTVLRLSAGMARSPRLVASNSSLMSGGTVVRFSGMTSPWRSGATLPPPRVGNSATYCSPTADTLWTCACTLDGMSMPEFIASVADTPVSVSCTLFTRPTSVPR